jgi:hypothetical protein
MKTRSLGEKKQAGPLFIPWRVADSRLKYISVCCFSRAYAKGENLSALCLRAAKATTDLRQSGPLNPDLSLFGTFIGPQIPLPNLKPLPTSRAKNKAKIRTTYLLEVLKVLASKGCPNQR